MKKLNIRQFGIGRLTKFRPLISSDSKFVFTIGDECVYVWIVKTGECLRVINQISYLTDQQSIVSIAINPHNRLQLCVGESNGNIKIWDYEDGILIHTIQLENQLIELISIANQCLYAFIQNAKNIYSLIRFESIRHQSSSTVVFNKLPCLPKSISFDRKGECGVFINEDGTMIYLLNLINNQMKTISLTKENLSFHQKLTCVQIHPEQECLAFGTHSGRILLWYNYLTNSLNEGRISYLHWHSLPVICLSFSLDGSYLLSGGYECVLVKWIYKKSEPTFRPRLSSAILHLNSSNDQTFYVSTHSDNSIHFIGSNFVIEQTISAINQSYLPQQSSLPAGLHLLMNERAIVMNSGRPGYLQFMSIDNGKLLYNLDIVGENYISPNEITEQCIYTDIKRLAIDPTEKWLVTFEERPSNVQTDDQLNERKLRFWFFNSTTKQFELNTSILYPHGQETLNEMLFHPRILQLVTTGNDGFVKFWNLIPENVQTKSSSHWRCLSGQSHRGYRSKCLSYYSRSNEMNLCCSFEHLITIWKEEMNESSEQLEYNFIRCLAHFDKKNLVQSMSIDCDQIVVCHETLVNIWNITNGTFLKTFSWNVHSMAKDPKSHFIALFEKSFLHLYSFADGKCHSRKSSLFRRVRSAIFIPNEKSKSTTILPFQQSKLIFYISDEGLKTFVDDDEDQDEEKNFIDRMETNVSEKSSLAQLILQSEINVEEKGKSFDDLTALNKKIHSFNEQLLSTPAYLFPRIDHFCIDSLKGMLLTNRQTVEENNPTVEENLSTMSIDSQDHL